MIITVSSWKRRINCNFEKKNVTTVKFSNVRPNIDIFLKKKIDRGMPHWHTLKRKSCIKASREMRFLFQSLYRYSVYFTRKPDFHVLFVSSQASRVAFSVASLTICVIGFTH